LTSISTLVWSKNQTRPERSETGMTLPGPTPPVAVRHWTATRKRPEARQRSVPDGTQGAVDPSSSRTTRVAAPRAASTVAPPVGWDRVRAIVSLPSARTSSWTVTVKVFAPLSPGPQVRIPEVAA
jgi:hypothetical protein